MRCPDCNKFVSFDEIEPEVNDLSISEDGTIDAEVRIVNACADCGMELKEAIFNVEQEIDVEGHTGEAHELEIEENGVERTSKSGYFDKKKGWVNSYGRYAKTLYGFSLTAKVTCSCSEFDEDVTLEDEIQASGMDELV